MRLAFAVLTPLFGLLFTDLRSLAKDTCTQEENTMLEKLLAIENANMERWRRGDPMGWTEISAPEVTYVDPELTKPIDGLEAYTDFLKQLIGKIQYDISEFINPRERRDANAPVIEQGFERTVDLTECPAPRTGNPQRHSPSRVRWGGRLSLNNCRLAGVGSGVGWFCISVR